MGIFGRRKVLTAGLTLDNDAFHYISLEKSGEFYRVAEAVTEKFPPGMGGEDSPFADSGAHLSRFFEFAAAKTASFNVPVNIGIPITDSLLRTVNMPGMTAAEAKMAIRYDFENYFPFSVGDAVYDISEIDYPVRDDLTEKRFIAAAARSSLIDNIARAAASNGLKTASMEPAQIALERAATPDSPVEEGCVYVYAGYHRSVLVLSWRGNGIFYRNISFGVDDEIVAKGTESDEYREQAVAFVRDVRSSLQFALSQNRGFSARSVYIFGPGASAFLCDTLKESVSFDSVMLVDPMKVHGIDFSGGGEWDIALGLALR
ncbi:MAG: pilus assembly protein PilM [Synergistaceae bacterium]|nr:pilus assembly protein PilM [Synergistaceae bacterium]